MNALATAPGVISPAGKYYISANEVMEYLGCGENKAYGLIRTDTGISDRESAKKVFF